MKHTIVLILTATALLAGLALVLKGNQSKTQLSMKTANVTVRLVNPDFTPGEPISVPRIERSEAEWKVRLTPEQFNVARTEGTETAFCGVFHDNHRSGLYTCIGCGLPLFRSDAKFDSGTGWPSFFQPFAAENIGTTADVSFGMVRNEIHCERCGTHLGHVFPDGPAPTGLRYCINSAALGFEEFTPKRTESAIFGAGCFWGVEEAFAKVKGVLETAVGYSGGFTKNPTYQDVCSHSTGHAEVVKVEYDPSVVSYDALLDLFFSIHNPTTLNRQGFDFGDNYRSAIFFTSPAQEAAARSRIAALEQQEKWKNPIVTQVDAAGVFNRAEDYHQQYAAKHGGGFCHAPGL